MKNFFKEAPNKILKIEGKRKIVLGKGIDNARQQMFDKVKMLLAENKLSAGEDLERLPLHLLTRISEILKDTPRSKALLNNYEYTRFMTREIQKIIESFETAIRA